MAEQILRIGKLKSIGAVAGAASHIQRKRLTANADPSKENTYLVGDPKDNIPGLVVGKIGKQKIRKNAVWAVEMLISASPEYFELSATSEAGIWNEPKVTAFQKAVTDWLKKKYGQNIVAAVLHRDELTPHIHVLIVPLFGEDKKLNCRAIFGGTKYVMAELQASLHDAVKHLGFKRGIERSGATHLEMKEIYSLLRAPLLALKKLEMEPPAPVRLEPVKNRLAIFDSDKKSEYENDLKAWHTENRYRQDYYEALEKHHHEQMDSLKPYLASAGKIKVLKQQNEDLKAHNARIAKQLSAVESQSVKPMILTEVLAQVYGAKKVETSIKSGKVHWFSIGTREIEVADGYWKDLATGKKGTWAVDLVAHLEGFPPDREMDAIPLLVAKFGKDRVVADVNSRYLNSAKSAVEKSLAQPCPLPSPAIERLPLLEAFLVKTLNVPADVASKAIETKQVYIDSLDNLVFPRSSGGFVRQSLKMRSGKSIRRDEVLVNPMPYVIAGDERELVLSDNELEAWVLKARYPQSKIIAINCSSTAAIHQHLNTAQTLVVTFDIKASTNTNKDWHIFLGEHGKFANLVTFILPSDFLEGCGSWLTLLQTPNSAEVSHVVDEPSPPQNSPKGPGM